MKEQITNIRNEAKLSIQNAKDKKALNDIRVKVLGKKGELTSILRGMANLSAEERPVIGNLVNSVKQELEEIIKQKENEFEEKELQEKLEKEKIDVTLPSTKIKRGSKHPINRTIEEIRGFVCINGI